MSLRPSPGAFPDQWQTVPQSLLLWADKLEDEERAGPDSGCRNSDDDALQTESGRTRL